MKTQQDPNKDPTRKLKVKCKLMAMFEMCLFAFCVPVIMVD